MQVLPAARNESQRVVEDMGRLLPRLIGEDIDLEIRTAKNLGAIKADASQMEKSS